MTDPKDCKHLCLFFGSGGYYVICSMCSAYWVAMIGSDSQRDGTRALAGLGGHDIRISSKSEHFNATQKICEVPLDS